MGVKMRLRWFKQQNDGARSQEYSAPEPGRAGTPSNSDNVPRSKPRKWAFKWSLKLRDRISHSLSFRKSIALSEVSNSKRIPAHEHQQPDDWGHIAFTSKFAADSQCLHRLEDSMLLQPATSAGSFRTAESTVSCQSVFSISCVEESNQQEKDATPDLQFIGPEAVSSPNSRTQTQKHSLPAIPAIPDLDPPGTPALRSSEIQSSRDEDLWQSFLPLCQESRWLAAGDKMGLVVDADMGDEVYAAAMCRQQTEAVHEVTGMVQDLHRFEKSLSDTSGYQQNSNKPLQMFYRPPVQGQIHNIRAIADFSLKTVEVLALAREFDLVKTWNWTAADSAILETRGDLDVDAMAVLKMPWPYKPRFVSFSCKGGDFLDERSCVAIFFGSPPPEGKKPLGTENAEEVRVVPGSGLSIEPCWRHEGGQLVEGCRVSVQMNIDPLMAFVPPIIINFVLMVMSPIVYRLAKGVVASSRKPGTKLNQRLKERAGFYNRIDARVQQYLTSKSVEGLHVSQH